MCQNLIDYIRAGEAEPVHDGEQPHVIDTELKYDSAHTIQRFFMDSEKTTSIPYFYQVRGFLNYISDHLGNMEAQDRLMDIRDMLTTECFPNGAFDTKEPEPKLIPDQDIVAACNAATTHVLTW